MQESLRRPPNEIAATSADLLSGARCDDQEAWRELEYVYGPVIRYWISRMGVRDSSSLQDVYQDVFLSVVRNLKRFQREEGKAKFRAWLKVITFNKVNDHFRRNGKQPIAIGGSTAALRIEEIAAVELESLDSVLTESPQKKTETEAALETREALLTLKAEFREQTWTAFWRTAVDGLNATDAASELGISSAAVRQAKCRVLRRLRDALPSSEELR
ncbi:MAG: sigma-70 family RNA polymerase sigma factor [Planctomycetaceae bacterium]|nr:sigma-70 family RNA polymerase sigma factor [Planctomycetaceae bacterium]